MALNLFLSIFLCLRLRLFNTMSPDTSLNQNKPLLYLQLLNPTALNLLLDTFLCLRFLNTTALNLPDTSLNQSKQPLLYLQFLNPTALNLLLNISLNKIKQPLLNHPHLTTSNIVMRTQWQPSGYRLV
jgi:hypothetical protein